MIWSEVLPALNLLLGLVGFATLLLRTSRRWGEYPEEIRWLLGLACGLFFGLLVTSGEIFLLRAGSQLIITVLMITVVKMLALFVLWRTHTTKYRTGPRYLESDPGINRDSMNPDKNIPKERP